MKKRIKGSEVTRILRCVLALTEFREVSKKIADLAAEFELAGVWDANVELDKALKDYHSRMLGILNDFGIDE